jgi:hypothetical protein
MGPHHQGRQYPARIIILDSEHLSKVYADAASASRTAEKRRDDRSRGIRPVHYSREPHQGARRERREEASRSPATTRASATSAWACSNSREVKR